MSLFKTKELWFQTNPHEENFAVHSLAFFPSTDLISNSSNIDLILSASLNGVLRLYHVLPNINVTDAEQSEKPNSLLLETSMNFPILQLEVGNFSRYVIY